MKRRLVRVAAPAALAVVALVVVLPRVTGSPWRAIGTAWSSVTWWQLGLLSLLWFAGLVAHSTVLMAAMPGLTRRRALTLNMTGSAVANVLPLGGGAGIGLNYVMVRRWGFSSGQFSLLTVLSNVWSVLAKAALPVLAVTLLITRDVPIDRRILVGAVSGSAFLLAAVGIAAAAACSDRGARLAGQVARRLASWTHSRHEGSGVERRLVELRRSASSIVRTGWQRMTVGMIAYNALGALLMWACLHVLGSTLGPVAILALFAFERALTALPITPGGSGVVEVATTALAIAFNGPDERAVVAAGVLLYRAFTFGLEIPVGGLWLLGWLLANRLSKKPDLPSAPVALGEAA
ncbi:MAG: lysylphosphatidylglycerol synthase transmembrane domain-containing protein [Actinomycetes bacterium]